MEVELPVPPASVPLRLFRIIIISALVACIVAAWVLFIETFAPKWDGGYIIVIGALGVFQTLLAEPFLRPFEVSRMSRFQVRLADLAILLVLLKLAPYLDRGWDTFSTDLATWLSNPGALFTQEFILGSLFLTLIWVVAIDIARGLDQLADASDPQSQSAGLSAIKTDFIIGAYILLFAVGLRHVILVFSKLDLTPGAADLQLILPLIYIGLGLMLLGQARLALLTASWQREQVPIDPRLGGRWGLWGVLFVLGVGVVALLMPAGNTIAGFYVLLWLSQASGVFVEFLLSILLTLLSIILAPCMALFQLQTAQKTTQVAPVAPELPPVGGTPDWMLALRSIIFWVVLLVILFFLIRIYMQDREGLLSGALFRRLLNWVRAFWASLRQSYQQLAVRLTLPMLRRAPATRDTETSWWNRWRARTTRERVRRLYLILLQRAAKSGYPRSPDLTPFEYVSQLEPQLPAEQEALERLTEAFVQARYDRTDFTPEEVGFLHRLWERLQNALRRTRHD